MTQQEPWLRLGYPGKGPPFWPMFKMKLSDHFLFTAAAISLFSGLPTAHAFAFGPLDRWPPPRRIVDSGLNITRRRVVCCDQQHTPSVIAKSTNVNCSYRSERLVTRRARGRRWLDEMVSGSVTDVQQIASRQKCSVRQVNMTISLAFLAPDLVRAAVEGRLPRGIGVERLRDAPAEWSQQFEALGLNPR